MRPKIFVTRAIPRTALAKLEEFGEVRMWEQEHIPVPRAVLEEELATADGLYCLLTDTIDEVLLERAPRLKVISTMAVGFDNIDIDAATKRGIMVTNTPGVLTETTADLTFTLLTATARRLVEAADYLKEERWKTWSPLELTGQDIYGATLGIVGMGRIGEAVARRAKGFDMQVIYYNRNRKQQVEQELDITYVEFKQLLRQSDFVCIMTPLTPETKNLIGAEELALMKETAVLINTARGGVVNEDALYHALKHGEIWGAGLDVFEEEPVPISHPLLKLPNIIAIPHIGSASIRTRLRMADIAADNLIQGLKGDVPIHLVNSKLDTKEKGKVR